MRKTRIKFLRKLVKDKDVNMLLSVRNYAGERTKDMGEENIFELAKRLWLTGFKERKLWGVK